MDPSLRLVSAARTVDVVLRHALDPEHAIEMLYLEYGFDDLVHILVRLDNPAAGAALWNVLCLSAMESEGFTA